MPVLINNYEYIYSSNNGLLYAILKVIELASVLSV